MALTTPYTFVNATAISAAEVNANFAAVTAGAADKAGDTFTGTVVMPTLTVGGDVSIGGVLTVTGSISGTIALAGDVSGSIGASVVGKLNGQSLGSLATGLLKNTTSTGVPTIAQAGTDYALPNANTSGYAAALAVPSQAAFDLFYATSATAVGRLANSTAGKVLTCGGAGVAPSWESASAPGAHTLTSSTHAMTGLTSGHFLRATSTTAFGWVAVTAADVGAAPSSGIANDATSATIYSTADTIMLREHSGDHYVRNWLASGSSATLTFTGGNYHHWDADAFYKTGATRMLGNGTYPWLNVYVAPTGTAGTRMLTVDAGTGLMHTAALPTTYSPSGASDSGGTPTSITVVDGVVTAISFN